MKRIIPILVLAAALLAIVISTAHAQDGHGDTGAGGDDGHGDGAAGDEIAALRGAAVYAQFCQACHGPHGEAVADGPAFRAITADAESAREVITNGRDSSEADGVAMPAFNDIIDDGALDDLMAYIATWESGETPPLPAPNLHAVPDHVPDYFGDPHAGALTYARFCSGCHGADGEGRGRDAFPSLDFAPGQTIMLVRDGTESVYMPAFGADNGGPLDEQQLIDLETYLASWQMADDSGDESDSAGISVLLIVVGAGMIAGIGAIYMVRSSEEPYTGEL